MSGENWLYKPYRPSKRASSGALAHTQIPLEFAKTGRHYPNWGSLPFDRLRTSGGKAPPRDDTWSFFPKEGHRRCPGNTPKKQPTGRRSPDRSPFASVRRPSVIEIERIPSCPTARHPLIRYLSAGRPVSDLLVGLWYGQLKHRQPANSILRFL